MPYKSMKDQIKANKRYRERKKAQSQKQVNHIKYLESKIQRLNKIIEQLQSKIILPL